MTLLVDLPFSLETDVNRYYLLMDKIFSIIRTDLTKSLLREIGSFTALRRLELGEIDILFCKEIGSEGTRHLFTVISRLCPYSVFLFFFHEAKTFTLFSSKCT